MNQTITATFADGVLKPVVPLKLPPNSEVRLTIETLPVSPITIGSLNAFLSSLPPLGDDAEQFAQDVSAMRAQIQPEASPGE
jgi:predicted DNA-binding antitoxin AbrB/MazE fold protein